MKEDCHRWRKKKQKKLERTKKKFAIYLEVLHKFYNACNSMRVQCSVSIVYYVCHRMPVDLFENSNNENVRWKMEDPWRKSEKRINLFAKQTIPNV